MITLLVATHTPYAASAEDSPVQADTGKPSERAERVKAISEGLLTARREGKGWRFVFIEGSDGWHGGTQLQSAILKGDGFEIDLGSGGLIVGHQNKTRSFKLSDDLVRSATLELRYSYSGNLATAAGVKLGDLKGFSVKLLEVTESANKAVDINREPDAGSTVAPSEGVKNSDDASLPAPDESP